METIMNRSDVPIDFSMSDWEILKCEEYIQDKDLMLEWGAGGSTLYFSTMVGKFISIEDNKSWSDKINLHKNKNTEIYYVPSHEIKLDDYLDKKAFKILKGSNEWYEKHGKKEIHESDGKTYWTTRGKSDWHCYIDYINKPTELKYNNYDVILVDGRARSMCAYVAKDLLKKTGYLLVHDFNNRPYYHGILNWFEKVDEEESLAVLTLKKGKSNE
mgnify:FL=1